MKKILLERISGNGKEKSCVILKEEGKKELYAEKAAKKIGGRGARIVIDSGVREKVTVVKKTGAVVGEYWVTEK